MLPWKGRDRMVLPFRFKPKSSEEGLVDDNCQCWSDVSIRTTVHDSLCYQHSNRGYDPRPLNARPPDSLNNIARYSFPVHAKVCHISIDQWAHPQSILLTNQNTAYPTPRPSGNMIHGRHRDVSLNFQAKIPTARMPNIVPMILGSIYPGKKRPAQTADQTIGRKDPGGRVNRSFGLWTQRPSRSWLRQ
jgi:hypothetical protein